MNIKVGHVYRAKKPRCVGATFLHRGFYNDRQVIYVSNTVVQYDSPSVNNGHKYSSISRAKFENWVGADITDKLIPHKWEQFYKE